MQPYKQRPLVVGPIVLAGFAADILTERAGGLHSVLFLWALVSLNLFFVGYLLGWLTRKVENRRGREFRSLKRLDMVRLDLPEDR